MKTGIIRLMDNLGRVVIPKGIRETLGVKDGASCEISVEDGKIILTPYTPEAEVKGAMTAAKNAVDGNFNELSENGLDFVRKIANDILAKVGDMPKRIMGLPIKETVCVSKDKFEEILDDIYGIHEYDTEYSLDGLSIWTEESKELPIEEDLSKYFGRAVSTVHLDDCEYIGVWIVFA